MRKYWLIILQCALSLVLIWRLFGNEELRAEATRVIKTADPLLLLAGFGTAILCELLCALRWWLMLRVFGTPVSFARTCAFCGAGLFFSLSLPGGAGGDLFRILYVVRLYPKRRLPAILSVFADRLSGLAALVLALGLSLAFRRNLFAFEPAAHELLMAATLMLGSVVLLVFLWWLCSHRKLHPLWFPFAPTGIKKKAVRMGRIFTGLTQRPGLVTAGILTSIAALAVHFTTYFCSARAFRLPIGLLDIFTVMPVVETLILLPITLYGVGLRETLFEHLLGGMFSIPHGAATLTSLAGFGLQAAVGLMGGLLIPFTVPRRVLAPPTISSRTRSKS
jgi:glycosyltransferase 2 family protein